MGMERARIYRREKDLAGGFRLNRRRVWRAPEGDGTGAAGNGQGTGGGTSAGTGGDQANAALEALRAEMLAELKKRDDAITALTTDRDALAADKEKAVKDAAAARDKLRGLDKTVREALGLETDDTPSNEPWEKRIAALGDVLVKKIDERVGAVEAQLEAEKKTANEAKLTALKLQVGRKHGLSDEVALLLQGETEEALRTHAERVMKSLPGGGSFSPTNPDGGQGTPASTLADRIYRQRKPFQNIENMFSPEGNAAMGGGVRQTSS